MKPTTTYSEYVTEDGRDLEIKGEVFDTPIKKTEVLQFYTRVSITDVNSKETINNLYFVNENNEDELRVLVSGIKNEPKYLKL
jgi:hypothetical protein